MNTKPDHRKLPSDWAREGVFLISNNWRPVVGDDCNAYTVEDYKVEAVVEFFDGVTIRFNYVRRNADHTREVRVVTQTVRYDKHVATKYGVMRRY